ncbi:auxin efflux carrier component 3-like protein [Tanacetum coccineum]
MNLKFIAADGVSKILTLIVLFLWTNLSKKGNLDWAITIFSLSTLPNTLVMGIPLLKSMYGDDKETIMVQAVVLQCIIWYTLLLFLFEYREAKNLLSVTYEKDGSDCSINSSMEVQERVERRSCNDDDIVNVILSTPSNPHMLHSLNRVAPAVASAVEDNVRELHLFIWRCRCCTSPGVCEQSVEVCSRENEKAESVEESNTNLSLGSPKMLKKILIMVTSSLFTSISVVKDQDFLTLVSVYYDIYRWGIKKPQILENSVTILSNAGLGMAMFSLGLFMASQPKLIACGNRLAAYGMVARFVAGPAVMAVASIAVGLRGTILQVSIVQASLPQGIVPFVFAREYNLHPDGDIWDDNLFAHHNVVLYITWSLKEANGVRKKVKMIRPFYTMKKREEKKKAGEVSEMTEEYSEDNLVSKINYNCLYHTGRCVEGSREELGGVEGPGDPNVATNNEFTMRAMLLWTINDFPARSSLSGWSGQGYFACPTYLYPRSIEAIRVYRDECLAPMEDGYMYYGLLEEILELYYVVQDVNHQKIWDKDIIVEDTHVIQDVIHDNISSDLALTTNLEDLDYTRLSGVGPSTEVNFVPTSLVDDDDFIDDDDE